MPRNFMECKTFEELEKSARIKKLTPAEQAAYDHSLKVLRDNFYIADHERSQGRIEGETMAMKRTARKLRSRNMPIEDISDITGLTYEEIVNL